ncbi:lamin tail domain-containing protein, partial [bacterium]|nr:lamin tail domain-containing protein [bacterium]
ATLYMACIDGEWLIDDSCVCNDGYSLVDGVCTLDQGLTIDWCSTQWPLSFTVDAGSESEAIYGQLYVEGVTEASSEPTEITAQLCYTTDSTLTTNITCVEALWDDTFSHASNDQYVTWVTITTPGTYYYFYQFSGDSGNSWSRCDLSDPNGGTSYNMSESFEGSYGVATVNGGGGTKTVLISEVVDHKESANAKFVEIYNPTSEAVSINGWKVKIYANGATTSSSSYTYPDVLLQPGETFVVTNTLSTFQTAFPDVTADAASGSISGNGDDVYELVDNSGNRVDIYGEIGVDGTGTAWEYLDGVARRNMDVVAGSITWTASEWTITLSSSLEATPKAR